MAKAQFEKTIRISAKPAKKQGISASFVEGDKQSKVKTPKSLTPEKKMARERKA